MSCTGDSGHSGHGSDGGDGGRSGRPWCDDAHGGRRVSGGAEDWKAAPVVSVEAPRSGDALRVDPHGATAAAIGTEACNDERIALLPGKW